MNVEIEKTFHFNAIVVAQDCEPWINTYDVKILMEICTTDNNQYNIAYQRLQFWFHNIMNDCVLIKSDHALLNHWRCTNARCLEMPTDVVDQTVGMMLMKKTTSITESRINILNLMISSPADDYLGYRIDMEDHLHWFEEPGWWQDSRPNYVAKAAYQTAAKKIIQMPRNDDWKDHDLDWVQLLSKNCKVTLLSDGHTNA